MCWQEAEIFTHIMRIATKYTHSQPRAEWLSISGHMNLRAEFTNNDRNEYVNCELKPTFMFWNAQLQQTSKCSFNATQCSALIWLSLFDGSFLHSSACDDFDCAFFPLLRFFSLYSFFFLPFYYDVCVFFFLSTIECWSLTCSYAYCGFIPRTVKPERCMISFVYFICLCFCFRLLYAVKIRLTSTEMAPCRSKWIPSKNISNEQKELSI